MSGTGKVVAVTGGSGYIASWLVRFLLERGYTVKVSVRNLNDTKKIEHLLSLDGGKERLHLFQADLLEEGSFDPLVDGCDGVFHTASPVAFTVSDPQAELIEPAVKGTLNVLRSCSKVKSIKRVIVTSSVAAVVNNGEVKDGDVIDESCFSDPLYCEERKLWYVLSKTLAEDGAWKFANEHGIDMVAINPGYVFGPIFQPSASLTPRALLDLVNGAESYTNSVCRFVDVRDVATAHILAFEIASASGRYCVVGTTAHWSEAINILRELYPTLSLPNKCEEDPRSKFTISKKKAEGLGIQFYPLEVTLKDTIDSLAELNLLNR